MTTDDSRDDGRGRPGKTHKKPTGAGKKDRVGAPLGDGDIVTHVRLGRRSALAAIGTGIAGTLGVVSGARRARSADTQDVTRRGDSFGDADSSDPASDEDVTQVADAAEEFDEDSFREADPLDSDTGANEDAGDEDFTMPGDPKANSDPGDADKTQRSDPARQDVDPSDTGGDADQSRRADLGDFD